MANVFVYGGIAEAAGALVNHRTPNLACISFIYLSVFRLFISIKLLFTNKYKVNRLDFFKYDGRSKTV